MATPLPSNDSARASVMRGIGFMVASAFLAAAMNSMARHVTETIHPFELVFFRNLFAFLFVVPMLMRVGLGVLRTQRIGMHTARASVNTLNMLIWFTAVSITPLAEMTALAFTAPIFATVLSVFLFREVVGVRRWSAIAVGFAGVLIILQPGFNDVTLGHGLTLIAATTWAVVLLMIKSLSRTEDSLTIVAYMAILMTPLSLPAALLVWEWPTWTELGWMAAVGFAGGAAQYLLAQAFHHGEISVIMPFDFFKLIWVAVIAYLVFSEIPEWTTWIGGAIIFASTLYIAHRETMRRRAEGD